MLTAIPTVWANEFTTEEICTGYLAGSNGHNPSDYVPLGQEEGAYAFGFTRDDGKVFGYLCRLEGSVIRWFGTNTGRWNQNLKASYGVEGGNLVIRETLQAKINGVYHSENMGVYRYSKADF